HGNKTLAISVVCIDGGLRRCGGPGPAWSGHSPGPDRAAITIARRELRPDASPAAPRPGGARRHDHWTASRAAWRQTGALRWRAVPARRHRSRNARADAGCRQDPGYSAARQPWRRPLDPAEITPFTGLFRTCRVCLTAPRPTSYMPRVRDCGI